MKTYVYIGPHDLADVVKPGHRGRAVERGADVVAWATDPHVERERSGTFAATYVVDAEGRLRIANRRSEHVACAGGGEVLCAGLMWFRVDGDSVEVEEVDNLSSGYCPESSAWPAVAAALDAASIERPGCFTTAYEFRRCEACGQRNVVKHGVFECMACGAALPEAWNFGDDTEATP